MTIEEQLKEIIMEHLGVTADEITPDALFADDLGADSLALVELILEIENKFNLPDIPDDEAEKLLSVGDALRYLEEHFKE